MLDFDDEQVVLKGPAATIAYAMKANGKMPAKEFLESTKGKDAPSRQEKAGLIHLFQLMVNKGKIYNKELFRKLRGNIFEFKKNQVRLLAFREGNIWYLTHGFKKKKNKCEIKEIERAEGIRSEQLGKFRKL